MFDEGRYDWGFEIEFGRVDFESMEARMMSFEIREEVGLGRSAILFVDVRHN